MDDDKVQTENYLTAEFNSDNLLKLKRTNMKLICQYRISNPVASVYSSPVGDLRLNSH